MNVVLLNDRGREVATVRIAPIKGRPPAIIYGERVFIYSDGTGRRREGYFELSGAVVGTKTKT